jgi:hypothetical protein
VTANRIFASHSEPPRRLSNAELQRCVSVRDGP